MEFWGEASDLYHVTIQSPTGERLQVSSALKYGTQELAFVFVETKVMVNYVPIERRSGNTLIFFRFLHPAEGIWKLETSGRLNSSARFHVWLPVQGMISEETYFLESSPEYTVTAPGDAVNGMTVTAYQYRDDSLYSKASRGYNTDNVVKPDFAAPGVDMNVHSVIGNKSCSGADLRHCSSFICMGHYPWQRAFFFRKQCKKLSEKRGGQRRRYAVSKSGMGVWKNRPVSHL